MYYWAIRWKSFADPDLLVSEKQAQYIDSMLDKKEDERPQHFKINGERYSFSDIRRIEQTTKRVEDNTVKLLYSGEDKRNSRGPIIDGEGNVLTNWYKRLVSQKEYDSYYSKQSSYYTLTKEDNGVYIGIRLPEMENGERSSDLELCTKAEAERLWNMLPSWSR